MIAGEVSGDLHGGALLQAVRAVDPSIEAFGMGGDRMAREGFRILRHAHEMAFLGFFEVVRHYPFIHKVYNEMKAALKTEKPDLLILVDYPGFNLKFAREAKKLGVPVLYYISPQIWAWAGHRIHTIKKLVNHMVVFFPFEETLYQDAGVPVTFVGHPLKDKFSVSESKETFFRKWGLDPAKKTIGLLPGSRKQEVTSLLPEMIGAAELLKKMFPDLQCLVAQTSSLPDALYQPAMDHPFIQIVKDETYSVMAHADAVIVASGTATLETALANTPMVILYKMAPISYWIGKHLVEVDHIGLVNIVAGKGIVPELIQHEATAKNISETLLPFLTDKEQVQKTKQELQIVSEKLGDKGAADRAAQVVLKMLEGK